jgi:prepilin-type processing-associated H-X9-DG protein
MGHLDAGDRDAILLRFFDRQPFRAVGESLGTTEEGARKRVDRALEKLRSHFARRGLGVSALILAQALDLGAASTAPAGLSAAVATGALAGAAKGALGGISLLKLMILTKTNIAAAAAVAGLATILVYQHNTNSRLREENSALRGQAARVDVLRAENEKLAAQPTAPPAESSESQVRELARLRGQVDALKRQLAKAAAQPSPPTAPPPQPAAPAPDSAEAQKELAIAKMNYSKQLMLAFVMYAGDHNQTFPGNFKDIADYFPNYGGQTNVSTDQFQIVYQGSATNVTSPGETVVIREADATQTLDGGWYRTYAFADGHVEVHKEAINDFSNWESQHLQLPPQQ